jgi:hypothetical protein
MHAAVVDGTMKHLTLALSLLLFGACSHVEHDYDCHGICSKYADCVDSSYDVGACTDKCTQKADDDADFADRADTCQACVDDRACSEEFPCIDDCAGIVP